MIPKLKLLALSLPLGRLPLGRLVRLSTVLLASFSWIGLAPSPLSAHGGHYKNVSNQKTAEGGQVDRQAHSYRALVNSELAKVAIDEKVGRFLELDDLSFTSQDGKTVPLSQVMQNGKPTLLSFAYYTCPTLCQYVLDGKRQALAELGDFFHQQYNLVTISFDARDGTTVANATRERQVSLLQDAVEKAVGESVAAPQWDFFFGAEENIKKITSQLGFSYNWIAATGEFAHPAAIYVITPKGKVSRYFYGIQFKPFELKIALAEAKREEERTTAEKILIYCYQYDSESRGYALHARNVMKAGGLITIVVLAAFLSVMFRRERRRTQRISSEENSLSLNKDELDKYS